MQRPNKTTAARARLQVPKQTIGARRNTRRNCDVLQTHWPALWRGGGKCLLRRPIKKQQTSAGSERLLSDTMGDQRSARRANGWVSRRVRVLMSGNLESTKNSRTVDERTEELWTQNISTHTLADTCNFHRRGRDGRERAGRRDAGRRGGIVKDRRRRDESGRLGVDACHASVYGCLSRRPGHDWSRSIRRRAKSRTSSLL